MTKKQIAAFQSAKDTCKQFRYFYKTIGGKTWKSYKDWISYFLKQYKIYYPNLVFVFNEKGVVQFEPGDEAVSMLTKKQIKLLNKHAERLSTIIT